MLPNKQSKSLNVGAGAKLSTRFGSLLHGHGPAAAPLGAIVDPDEGTGGHAGGGAHPQRHPLATDAEAGHGKPRRAVDAHAMDPAAR
jgi:hypothetical protein